MAQSAAARQAPSMENAMAHDDTPHSQPATRTKTRDENEDADIELKPRDAVGAAEADTEAPAVVAKGAVPEGAPVPYSSFSQGMKLFIISLLAVAGIFSPISSNIFVPAIPSMAQAFGRSEQDITLAVSVYLVFQALTPSFLGSLSDSYGRRPVAISTLALYLGANIGLALVPTSSGGYAGLLVLRALQVGTMVGPAFGPLLGGVLAQTLGWRSIFWFLAIATGVVLVTLTFFLPETLRSLVGDGSIPPPRLNSSPQQLLQHRRARIERERTGVDKVHVDRPARKKYQPFSSFMILLRREIILVFIFSSLLYLEYYVILTVYSTILKDQYGLNELQIGLCYLPIGIGSAIAAAVQGRLMDIYYRREEARVGGDFRRYPELFRVERARFIVAIPFITLFAIGCIALGWCLQLRTHLAAVLVFNLLVGVAGGNINSLATVYGQDLVPGKGGAVSASLNLVRCMFGAIGTAIIQLIYNAMGAGWSFVLFTGLCVLALPLPLLVLQRGMQWRARRRDS